MGLFDKLTGTKRPDNGVTPRSAEDVQAMLLRRFVPANHEVRTLDHQWEAVSR